MRCQPAGVRRIDKSALTSLFCMIKRTHVPTIASAASPAELLPVRAARRGQDRLGARAVSRRAVLRSARSPDVHAVAGRAGAAPGPGAPRAQGMGGGGGG